MIITVVGLGVVGGSFVKALKGQGHKPMPPLNPKTKEALKRLYKWRKMKEL